MGDVYILFPVPQKPLLAENQQLPSFTISKTTLLFPAANGVVYAPSVVVFDACSDKV